MREREIFQWDKCWEDPLAWHKKPRDAGHFGSYSMQQNHAWMGESPKLRILISNVRNQISHVVSAARQCWWQACTRHAQKKDGELGSYWWMFYFVVLWEWGKKVQTFAIIHAWAWEKQNMCVFTHQKRNKKTVLVIEAHHWQWLPYMQLAVEARMDHWKVLMVFSYWHVHRSFHLKKNM